MKKRKPWALGIPGILIMAGLLGIVLAGVPSEVNAATTGEIRDQISSLESEQSAIQGKVDKLEQQLAENHAEMEETVQQKQVIDQQIFLLYDQIININEQIASYNVLIADKQDELDAAQKRHDTLKAAYKERIRAMEEDGKLSYWSVLFKSESFADFLDRMTMIEEIAASDQRRLQELQEATEAVADAQAALAEEKAAAEKTKASLDQTQLELLEKQEASDSLLEELRARGEEYELYLLEAEQKQSAVMQEVAQKNLELAEIQYQEWLATYVPPSTTAAAAAESGGTAAEPGAEGAAGATDAAGSSGGTDSGSSGGGWLTPVSGYYISSPFGPRINPFSGNEQWHEGIDMVCAGGTPIYATRSGIVTSASYNDSCGYYVYISHDDGYGSIYMHMTHYVVGYGEYVSQGQVIGYVGSTGESEVEHLHFGISYNGSYVNPMNYI